VILYLIIMFILANSISVISVNIDDKNKYYANITESINKKTLYVGGSGPNNYSSIQEAVDDANSGDTIFVFSGIYYEQVTIEEKSLNLIGEDRDTTIVDGKQENHGPVIKIFQTNYVNVSGFTVQNAQDWGGIGLLGGGHHQIIGNKCINNGGEAGIFMGSSNQNLVADNICNFNLISGIRLRSSEKKSTYNQIINNTCNSNNNYGIYNYRCNNNYYYLNNCSDNGKEGEGGLVDIILKSADNNTLVFNTCKGKTFFGITLSTSTNNTLENNVCLSKGIYLHYSTNHRLIGNSVKRGIKFNGEELSHWNSHILENNTANGKPICYYKNMDGNGINIPNNAAQVILANCKNFDIKNLQISDVNDGFQVGFSTDIEIISNAVSTIYLEGITLYTSHDNRVANNKIENIEYNSIFFSLSNNNNISYNQIQDCERGFYLGEQCNNNIIYNNNILDSKYGIELFYLGKNNSITYNSISVDIIGINIWGSCNNNLISNNQVFNSKYGFYIGSSSYNVISNNSEIRNNEIGIYLKGENEYTTISNNRINENNIDIQLEGSCNCEIYSNNITNSDFRGLYIKTLQDSFGSTVSIPKGNNIYYNNFIDNKENAYDEGKNIWYKSIGVSYGVGNYWDDYSGFDIFKPKGIGDLPYNIPKRFFYNWDKYPLMNPYTGKGIQNINQDIGNRYIKYLSLFLLI